ncbi:MAG: PDZ domain-containing protein [Myxococcota bacterium]
MAKQIHEEFGRAVRTRDLDAVAALLADGTIDVGRRVQVTKTRRDLPLNVVASADDNQEMLRLLLGAGAKINNRGMLGHTALMSAAGAGAVTNLETLLAAGADPNVRDLGGCDVLWYCVFYATEVPPEGAAATALTMIDMLIADGRFEVQSKKSADASSLLFSLHGEDDRLVERCIDFSTAEERSAALEKLVEEGSVGRARLVRPHLDSFDPDGLLERIRWGRPEKSLAAVEWLAEEGATLSGDGGARLIFSAHVNQAPEPILARLVQLGAELPPPVLGATFQTTGLVIANVLSETAADEAGLEPGDVLTAIDGNRCGTVDNIRAYLHSRNRGDTVQLRFTRDGVAKTASASLTLPVYGTLKF